MFNNLNFLQIFNLKQIKNHLLKTHLPVYLSLFLYTIVILLQYHAANIIYGVECFV